MIFHPNGNKINGFGSFKYDEQIEGNIFHFDSFIFKIPNSTLKGRILVKLSSTPLILWHLTCF